MALDFTLVLRAETAAAKAELEAAARGIQGVSTATEKSTAATKAGATADRAATTAKQASARASTQLAAANRQAAGSMGSLVAQFNDIGMMMAAGQNPLQLAIQQGTQITQEIGPMGAAGAAKALGAAFVSMVSPLNLITLGVIAAAGVMVQWLTSSSSEAGSAADEIERVRAAIEGVVTVTENLRLEREMMLSGVGSRDEQVILNENNRLLAERLSIERQIAENVGDVGMTGVSALEEALQARRDEINLQIQSNNEDLKGLELARQEKAETEAALDLAGKLKSAAAGITAGLQAADGTRLQQAFASAFPLANQLLGLAQGIVATIGGLQPGEPGVGMGRGSSPGGPLVGSGDLAALQAGGGTWRVAPPKLPGGGVGAGSGGGAAAARDEANALQELIASLEAEVEAARVTNPIQQEMLKHREALAGATEAERLKVEELIATREREAAAMDAAKERADFFEGLGTQAIDALITKGESFNDVLKTIVSSLIQAAIQAAIFGEGPFGDIFGGKSIFSGVFGGGKAEGGMVYGPGTSTSDSILTPLSNGEYVVNARATARNRHLLEAINAGGRVGPGRAAGGPIGGDVSRRSGQAGRDLPGSIYIDLRGANGDREIEERVRRGAAQVVSLYDREGLAVSVQRVSRDPKRRG